MAPFFFGEYFYCFSIALVIILVDTQRVSLMTINLKQYARDYKEIECGVDSFPRQKAKWLSNNLTPESVIKLCRKLHGHYFFTTGSCGVLSCVLDILFRDDSSQFVLLLSIDDKEGAEEIIDDYANQCHGQLLSSLSYEFGFDHVLWFSEGIYYDISYQRTLSDIIAFEWVDIDDCGASIEPFPVHLSPLENTGYSDAMMHQKIIQGTSYRITIHHLIEEIHDYCRANTKDLA